MNAMDRIDAVISVMGTPWKHSGIDVYKRQVLHAAELLHAAAVSAAEALLLHVTLAAAQLSERQPEPDSEAQAAARQPEALQIELPASVPDIPVEAVRRFSPLPAASASAVPSSPAI